MAMSKQAAELYREQFRKLVARPADEIRALAVRQRSLTAELLRKVRTTAGDLVDRWKVYDKLDVEIAAQLRDGDELETKTDEESRVARRRAYARAYQQARLAADELSAEVADGSTWIAWFQDSAEGAKEGAKAAAGAGREAAKAVKDTVDRVVDTGGGVLLVVAIGAAVGLALYGKNRGRR